MNNIKKIISEKAIKFGFDFVGFTKPKILSNDQKNLLKFLNNGLHGQMKWLERHYLKKTKPKKLWEKVKTIMVLGTNYGPKNNPLIYNTKKDIANVSVYAKNKDYHKVIEKKIIKLKNWIEQELNIEAKTFIDTSPVFEKTLAQMAGIGWQGKHTNLVSKSFGSWLFLSEIFLNEEIKVDPKENDHCGECEKCIDICPTNAIIDNYQIDARKCISYLTIEHKGPFPISLRKKIGNKIYGCDDCLSICPWNKFSEPTKSKELIPKKELIKPKIKYFLGFSEDKFNKYFIDSPIKRIGWESFMRNVIIAGGNSRQKKLIVDIKKFLTNSNALVRGTAIWACGQLMSKREKENLKNIYFSNENNKYVLFEWRQFND